MSVAHPRGAYGEAFSCRPVVAGAKAYYFAGFYGTVETTRNPRKNRTAAAKAGHFHNLCGTGKPVPFVGSGSPIQLLGAGPHPVFIPSGEPKAHGDTTKVVP